MGSLELIVPGRPSSLSMWGSCLQESTCELVFRSSVLGSVKENQTTKPEKSASLDVVIFQVYVHITPYVCCNSFKGKQMCMGGLGLAN